MPSRTASNTYYVYVLLSLKDGKFYIGFTNNLEKRLKQHFQGKNFSTKPRLPLKLIYYEACGSKKDTKRREKYFKSTIGRRFLKVRLRAYLSSLQKW